MHADYLRPADLPEALALLAARPGLRPVAGGTDVFPARTAAAAWMGAAPEPLLDLSRLPGRDRIEECGDHHRIGAGVTWTALRQAALPAWFAGLQAAAGTVGGAQVQNRATLVGNLCNASPAADGVPPLLALDAEIVLASAARGERRVPLAAFLRGNRATARAPDELATALRVPKPGSDARAGFLKLGARTHLVISIVMVAGVLEVADRHVVRARLAVGACAPVAQRLPMLETAMRGVPLVEAAAVPHDAHLDTLAPIDDPRGTAAYPRHAALTLVRRLLAELAA